MVTAPSMCLETSCPAPWATNLPGISCACNCTNHGKQVDVLSVHSFMLLIDRPATVCVQAWHMSSLTLINFQVRVGAILSSDTPYFLQCT